MTTATYIPIESTYAGQPLRELFVLTLHDPDSDTPHGSLTTNHPLPTGARGGPLTAVATRDGRRWRITLPEIEVCRSSSVGCEFLIFGRVQREPIGDA